MPQFEMGVTEVLFRGPFVAESWKFPNATVGNFHARGYLLSKWDIYQVASREIAVVFGQYTLQKRSTLHILSPLPGGSTILRPGAISVVNCSNFGEFHVGNSFSTIVKDLPYLRCS